MTYYALTIHPRREFEAARSLTRRGFKPYVPMKRVWRRPSRYVETRELRSMVLLPGYVLLKCDLPQPPWYRILNSRYVNGVVKVEENPLRVWPNDINELQERERKGEFTSDDGTKHMKPGQEFLVGDTVEAVLGPLTGQAGAVDAIRGDRARVWFQGMGGKVLVSVGLESLEKIEVAA